MYLGLAGKLLKTSGQLSYWAACRCTTPLATSRAQKCKSEGPVSGGGAQIWHQTASSVLPGHFRSSLLSGSGDDRKLSLDLRRYPTGRERRTYETSCTWCSQAQVESTGFSAIFEKLMITAGAQLYAYKTIRANNGRESENTVNHKYLTSSVESAPARSAWNRNICP